MSGKQIPDSTKRNTCQPAFSPTPSYFVARLPFLLAQLRAFERQVFSLDRCDAAGLAAAQCRLLFLRLQVGVPVSDGQLREARLALQGFLEPGP